jgi:hypothetical protein
VRVFGPSAVEFGAVEDRVSKINVPDVASATSRHRDIVAPLDVDAELSLFDLEPGKLGALFGDVELAVRALVLARNGAEVREICARRFLFVIDGAAQDFLVQKSRALSIIGLPYTFCIPGRPLILPTLVRGFHNGREKTNNYGGNCPSGCDSCNGWSTLDRRPALADSRVVTCVEAGPQAHRGICWAVAVRQLCPQSAV